MDKDTPALRLGMSSVVTDCCTTLLRQIVEAPGQSAIDKIGERLGRLTELMTPAEKE